jgi:hypothetical protein
MGEIEPLRVLRASRIDARPPRERWLIRPLWGYAAVGILGGAPKSCKTWLALDMALSVCSGTPCLGRFDVEQRGPALIYLAEDDLSLVRSRIDCLCRHRQLDIRSLELHVINEPCLRLDLALDQKRLSAAVEELRPRLLLLDPLIRIHRLDENSASEISGLLSFFRELQRRFECAVLLVHHTSKRQRAQPGQSLRGSSDLHAFGDSNAYLARQGDRLLMTVEHRAAKAPAPLILELVSDPKEAAVHLELEDVEDDAPSPGTCSMEENVLRILREASAPLPGTEIRKMLKVNNQRLGKALRHLQDRGKIERNGNAWEIAPGEPMEGQSLLFA